MTSHNFHVLSNVLKLLDGCEEPEILILSAIFHDIGNKFCKLPKVVESEAQDNEMLNQLGYAYRIEHQFHSVRIAKEILRQLGFTDETIIRVIELILEHDRRKYDEDFVSRSDTEMRLHLADAMWMLSDDGISRDIARAIEHDCEPMNEEEQRLYNQSLIDKWFHKESKRYEKLKEIL